MVDEITPLASHRMLRPSAVDPSSPGRLRKAGRRLQETRDIYTNCQNLSSGFAHMHFACLNL